MATPLPLQRHAASPTTATGDWLADIDATGYEKVQRRVIGQLLQTLLYEAALPYSCEPLGEHLHRFSVPLGDGVEYRCNGLLSTSFELIRLDHVSLERFDSAGQRSTPDLHLALTELL
ncbi:IucA/IucC family siderophore biosynthesis protein, partial [Pseudomonas syringae pv. actinidiae]|nr:IucA/IucC family siderophore biosynthesis protein [Pseudomonas syringae pv. actinidiae]